MTLEFSLEAAVGFSGYLRLFGVCFGQVDIGRIRGMRRIAIAM
jgi:hypothetical protein